MVVGDTEIIHRLELASGIHVLDPQPFSILPQQAVILLQVTCPSPAFLIDPERVLRRRPNHSTSNLEFQDLACPGKDRCEKSKVSATVFANDWHKMTCVKTILAALIR